MKQRNKYPFANFALILPSIGVQLILVVFASFAVILLSRCAQVVMPSGGAKDITPPKVTKYLPDSAAVNFKSKEINIVFNEYIQLKDVNNQLIVSPLLDDLPEIKLIKNHILNISFKKPLKENTTYTMNFGNSIADYNEGNEIDNFQYVFSTGPFIDSLSLSGKVQYAFDHKPEKGVLVLLYDASAYSDSTPYKSQPAYFGKTKADGTYKINNIRARKYNVFALKDENRNYKYNESEVIGFADQAIEINKNASVDVELFKEVPEKLKIINTSVVGYGHILLIFNRPTENLKIRALNTSNIPIEILESTKNKDSLHYWFEGAKVDSLKLQVNENDKIVDTVEVRLMSKEQAMKFEKDKLKLVVTSNVVPGRKFDKDNDILLKLNHPIPVLKSFSNLFKKNTVFYEDTILKTGYSLYNIDSPFPIKNTREIRLIRIDTMIEPSDLDHSVNDTLYVPIVWQLKENKKYKLFIPPKTFTDIFGIPNDTFKLNFTAQEEKFYGTIKLKLDLPPGGNYVLQFLDVKENVVKEEIVSESKTFEYEYLQPGAYKLKLILDANKDGKWSAGNYLEKTQPEKVIYYDKPITIRSNWDLELEWKINE